MTLKHLYPQVLLLREALYRVTKIDIYILFIIDKCLLVMDYTEGGTLRNYLSEKFSLMDWEIKCSFALEISAAIRSMHEKGIVHEDLNSNNIIVHKDSIRISDFGLSR